MKDFADVPNAVGTFPDVTAQNSSTGASLDGTAYIANVADNNSGWMQALLNFLGDTPNEVIEKGTVSQIFDSLQMAFGHPGEVVMWMGNDDPANFLTGLRILPLEGQGILRTSYPALDAATYVGDANNTSVAAAGGSFYHADDAAGTTPNETGIYLILPDARGQHLRMYDPAGTVDSDGTRFYGELQVSALEQHRHEPVRLIDTDETLFYNLLLIPQGTGANASVYSMTTFGAGSAAYADNVADVVNAANPFETTVKNICAGQLAIRY